MGRQLEDLAAVVAALSRAAGNSLDPSSILSRTISVLDRVVHVERVSLWLVDGDERTLAATHPAHARTADARSFEEQVAAPGARELPLDGRSRPIGCLVVQPAPGHELSTDDDALLEIAARQIAGALERAQLFTEVMELERLKSDFIARVSHELRTPITIVNGFLETLIAHDDRLDAEQRRHMLDRSRTAAARLGDLIEELLILSRIESGVLTPQPEVLDVADVLAAVRTASREPDQVLVDALPHQIVVADRALLVRALGLLVDNAIKYGGAAELLARTDAGRCTIRVRDRGPGFPEDVRNAAFEMFTRSQTNASVPGLGVGLAIARTLIEVLDGRVAIDETHAGPGALVHVSLPA